MILFSKFFIPAWISPLSLFVCRLTSTACSGEENCFMRLFFLLSVIKTIVLKIEGFEIPDGVRPCFYGERPTLDGNAEFWGSAGHHFYDGIVTNESGESVYKNGEPVKEEHYPMEEFSQWQPQTVLHKPRCHDNQIPIAFFREKIGSCLERQISEISVVFRKSVIGRICGIVPPSSCHY